MESGILSAFSYHPLAVSDKFQRSKTPTKICQLGQSLYLILKLYAKFYNGEHSWCPGQALGLWSKKYIV